MNDFANFGALLKWWRSIDKYLLSAFTILIFLGIFFIFSATPVIAKKLNLDRFYFVWKHFCYMVPAIGVMLAISMLDAKQIRRLSVILFIISFILLIFLPIVGTEIKGAKRWISLKFFVLEPSEVLKFSFIIFSAWMFSENKDTFPGYKISTLTCMLIVFLLLLQPDLGMTFLIFSSWIAQFFVVHLSLGFIVFLVCASLIPMCGIYFIFPHVSARIDKFLGLGENYQVQKSLESMAKGGFFGLGPGEGMVKRYLPDAHSDFIFSVIAEEFGIICCLMLIGLFAFIVIRSLILAKRSTDMFSKLSIFGISFIFGMQVIINISSSINLIPTKGMTLPFISYGGSSNFALGICAGILLGLTKKTINYSKYY